MKKIVKTTSTKMGNKYNTMNLFMIFHNLSSINMSDLV